MLIFFITTICYAAFVCLGVICMFINDSAWITLLPFLVYLFVLKTIYKEGTCKTLAYQDFITVLIFSAISYYLYYVVNQSVTIHQFTYFYLITFIASMMFINTIRFKSLI